jgi:hypothetical protein
VANLAAVKAKEKQDADTDLALRATLDPPLKAWCEEYGKKRNVRALLGTMHEVFRRDNTGMQSFERRFSKLSFSRLFRI